MKYLIMCEGPNEKAVIDLLLDADKLKYTRDDLLGLTPYHARQLNAPAVKANLNLYPGKVSVLRVGDTMTDQLKIPSAYRDKIDSVEKYCTKPELEMLLIHAEGLESQFEKVKSGKKRMKAKDFCKENVVYHRTRYNNSTQFYLDYFGQDVERLTNAILTYQKKNGSHKKGEHYLAELLR